MLIFLLLLNIGLLISWFHAGFIFGGGDTGLPLYNPSLVTEITKYVWWSQQGTGFSYPALLSSFPTYFLLSLFQKGGLDPLGLQILYFGSVLIFSTIGMYMLALHLSRKKSISFLITLFYLVNPYSMINIWHRGSFNGMMMLIVIPWSAYLLYRGFTEKKVIFPILLILLTLIFAYVFNTPAFIATWMFFVFALWIYLFFVDGWKGQRTFYLLLFVSFLILFLGTNLWWLLPFFKVAPSNLFASTTQSGNIGSLIGVSQYFTLQYAFRGISTFYPIVQQDWGAIFVNPFFDVLSFIEFGFVIVSLFYSKKIRAFGFFFAVFLIAIFVSKGSNPPFGNLIVYSFSIVPYLAVFRNPFEKFGVLIPFAESFLAGYGLYYIFFRTRKRAIKGGLILLFVGFLLYHWPFFTGNIFGNLSYSNAVQVPKEYNEVSSWFQKQGVTNPRILHLPLALGDGIIYDWSHGYWGLESSQLFFPGSSISHYLGIQFADDQYSSLALAVRNHDNKLFQLLLKKFGITYIVIHDDVDFTAYRTDSLRNINSFISSASYLQKKAQLGKLAIYQVKNAPQNFTQIVGIQHPTQIRGALSYYSPLIGQSNSSSIYVPDTQHILSTQSSTLYLPQTVLNPFSVSINPQFVIQQLPFVHYLSGSPLYPLIRFKEQFQFLGQEDFSRLLVQMDQSSKRLVEADRLADLQKTSLVNSTLDEYSRETQAIIPQFSQRLQSDILNYSIADLTPLAQIMLRQQYVLSGLSSKDNLVSSASFKHAQDTLNNLFSTSGLKSEFHIPLSLSTRVYRFSVDSNGNYFLVLGKDWGSFFQNKQYISLTIDGISQPESVTVTQDGISLVPLQLTKGIHEIGLPIQNNTVFPNEISQTSLQSQNSVSTSSATGNFKLKSNSTESYVDYSVKNFDPLNIYFVSYDYWTQQGANPKLQFLQDTDPITKKQIDVNAVGDPENYQFYWKSASASFIPNQFSQSLDIRIALDPWNNCADKNKNNSAVCMKPSIYNQFSRESDVSIKNVSVLKFPSNQVMLTSSGQTSSQTISLSYRQLNSTKYSVTLPKQRPEILELKETFHDGWKLLNTRGQVVSVPHVLVDGYANGWDVQSLPSGNYFLEFVPQNEEAQGLYIGAVLIIIGGGMVYYLWKTYLTK